MRRVLGSAVSVLVATTLVADLVGPAMAVTEPVRQRIAVPADVAAPAWVETRRQQQLSNLDSFEVFTGFGFTDRIEESGITFVHVATDNTGKRHRACHYTHGNGMAVADVDGDGRLDLYFLNQVGANELWRNLGGGRFEPLTTSPDLAVAEAISSGAAFGDTDNDGDPDLFVTTFRGGNHLFVNDGKGGFADVTVGSGLEYTGHSAASTLFDYDRDGLVDILVNNIGIFTSERLVTVPRDAVNPVADETFTFSDGLRDAFTGHFKPERTDRAILYHNEGDNRFRDVSAEVGFLDVGWGGDASPIDLNEDGWLDIFLLDMQGHDEYFENVEGERFVKKSRQYFPKTPWGTMGIVLLDYDNDTDLDICLTDMHSDMSEAVSPWEEERKSHMKFSESFLRSGGMSVYGNAFFRKVGVGEYEEVSQELGTESFWPWGPSIGDVNADGWEDIFVTGSMNYPHRYGVNSMWLNNRGARFMDAEYILGIEPRRGGHTAKPWFVLNCDGDDAGHEHCQGREGWVEVWGALGTRSAAVFDVDEDGDLDIVTNEFNAPPMVLISDLSDRKQIHFLKVKLVGTESNRSGYGATISLTAGGLTQTKFHVGNSGYLARSDMPVYFGLGDAASVDEISVQWPSGKTQTLPGPLVANRLLEITEP